MLRIYVATLALGLMLASSPSRADGKKVFLAKKCDSCHSVKIAKIDGKSKKVIDLSKVPSKRKSEWVIAYLEKSEKIDGKAHPPKFPGTAAELKAVADWLMSLKPPH
jgi:mono/diheme cytochrome c family protein